MRVRVVTLNLKGLGHGWFEERGEAVVRGLRELTPDVVCFQETTVRYEQVLYDQAAVIGAVLGLPVVAFSPYGNPIEVMSREHGGIALVSRWPIRTAHGRRLPSGQMPPDARTALLITLSAPDGELHIATTHPSWRPDETELRLMQIGVLLEHITRSGWCRPNARTILAGDLNATDHEPAISLLSDQLTDTFRSLHPREPGFTWLRENPLTDGHEPDRRLDYIFCNRTAKVLDARVVLDAADPVFPSDHAAVFAEIEWTDPK